MTYLYWRNLMLYCRYPVRHPTGIQRFAKTKAEDDRCMLLGVQYLAKLQSIDLSGNRFDKIKQIGAVALISKQLHEIELLLIDKPIEQPARTYNPKFWRIAGRYWLNELQYVSSHRSMRCHLSAVLNHFGNRYALEIRPEHVHEWVKKQQRKGVAINTINNRITCLKAAFRHSCEESSDYWRLSRNPVASVEKVSGGNIRTFYLTQKMFEDRYQYLKKESPRFALFYLALRETARRPVEVSQYRWEMHQTQIINGFEVHILRVPAVITKTKDDSIVVISERLWSEISQLGYRHGWIFRNAIGSHWTNWCIHMDKLKERFGKDQAGWARDNRRGAITHWCEVEKHDQFNVMQVSGHKTRSTFDRYRIGQIESQAEVILGRDKFESPSRTNCAQIGRKGSKSA